MTGVARLSAGLCALALLLTGCSSSGSAGRPSSSPARPSSSMPESYGGLPTFLPTSTVVPDSELTGDAARPALTTEGDDVAVRLASGSVRAQVSGPEVPGEGLPVETEATTCTWTVTLSGATVAVPIRIADFTTLDHLGGVYKTHTVAGSPPPPATLEPGASVTFELRAVMPTGEGLMRWSPGGTRVLASWDFEVETD